MNCFPTGLDHSRSGGREEQDGFCIAGLSEGVLAIDTNQEIILTATPPPLNLLHPVAVA